MKDFASFKQPVAKSFAKFYPVASSYCVREREIEIEIERKRERERERERRR